MRIDENLVEKIMGLIRELELEFQNHKALILTEDDFKCHLFKKIYSLIPNKLQTIDSDITGSALHSEVKFYDDNNNLTLVPDLTIISPQNISIYHSVEFRVTRKGPKYGRLPSKSFEIGGDAIIIELKFCRDKNGMNSEDIQKYKEDFDKIERLQEIVRRRSRGHDKLYGIVAVLNKTDNGKELFDSFKESNNNDNIRIFYGTGLVNFNNANHYPFDDGFVVQRHSTQ